MPPSPLACRAVLAAALAASLAVTGCGSDDPAADGAPAGEGATAGTDLPEPSGGFPVDRNLAEATTGRTIEATLTGRGEDVVQFVRRSDGSDYTVPLDRLSPADQAFIRQLPVTLATPVSPGDPGGGSAAVSAIDEAHHRIEALEQRFARETDPEAQARIRQQIQQVWVEIEGLQAAAETAPPGSAEP